MLQGILIGIKGILEKGEQANEILVVKAYVGSAISMLDGVIKGYETNKSTVIGSGVIDLNLDPEAQEAKNDLGG